MPRIHRTTWIVLALVAAALVLANVPGHRRRTADADFSMFQPNIGSSLAERFEHGWPWVYLQRDTSTLPCGFIPEPVSAWHFGQPVHWFYWPALAANLLVVGVIGAVVGALWERRCRRRKLWQISIVDGLAITAFIAAICGYAMFQFDVARREAAALSILRRPQPSPLGDWSSSTESEVVWPSAFTELAFKTPPAALTRVAEVQVIDAKHLRYLPEFRQLRSVEILPDVTTGELQSLAGCHGLRVLCFPAHTGFGTGLIGDYYDDLPATETLKIPALPQLEQLSISTPNYHGGGLEHFKKLKLLNLSRCTIDDNDLSRIGAMPGLVYLDLRDTPVTDAGLGHLSHLKKLECLRLPAQITDEGVRDLARLLKLRQLFLDNSQVTDETLPVLQQIPSLTVVDLRETGVTKEGIARLSAARPDCLVYHESHDLGPQIGLGSLGGSIDQENAALGALGEREATAP